MTKKETTNGAAHTTTKDIEACDRPQGTAAQAGPQRGGPALTPDEPKYTKYVFKSKYRRDTLKLFPADYAQGADGVRRIVRPAVWAHFEHNTWTTRDPLEANELRRQIADGDRRGVPLRVYEATEEAAQEAASAAREAVGA